MQFFFFFLILKVREGLGNLAMKILGPSTIVQAAIPDIFNNVPQDFHERNIKVFQVRLHIIMSVIILYMQ